MNKLNTLVDLLNEISALSKKIIKKTLSLIKKIDGDIFVKRVVSKLEPESGKSNLTNDVILSKAQELSLNFVNDAEKITLELDEFAQCVLDGTTNTTEFDNKFLIQVWNGDVYDKTGIDAIEELRNDLSSQLKNTTSKFLLELVVKNLKTN